MDCVICKTKLTGGQRKFCSRKCKNEAGNISFQSYLAQQKRGRDRKADLIILYGGCCTEGGYSRTFQFLSFITKIRKPGCFSLISGRFQIENGVRFWRRQKNAFCFVQIGMPSCTTLIVHSAANLY
jgi:hypothetical protein